MNAYTLLPALLFAVVMSVTPAQAEEALEEAPDLLTLAEARAFNGPFEHVVCLSGGGLNVRGDNLATVLFTAENYSTVKLFQGADAKKSKLINGRKIQFLKAQFPGRDESVGWVAESLVRPRSRCKAAPQVEPANPKGEEKEEDAELNPLSEVARIRGLNDPNCCQWPVKGQVTEDFATEQRRFGAGRGRRVHAACDLYRFRNEPIYSVAPGKVLRALYPFYQETFAIEVVHSGGFVVRYGEVTGKRAPGLQKGAPVRMGQEVGYMGKVSSGCCAPMLHFELYSGSGSGGLSTRGNKYNRRSDLMDPTPYLRRWQVSKFKDRR